ncbi:MAG: murein L,D-transpeptidase [Acidobacteria bacterium]|nr:murein L,D-transpeptidase [Acidobacteriota bacterium]
MLFKGFRSGAAITAAASLLLVLSSSGFNPVAQTRKAAPAAKKNTAKKQTGARKQPARPRREVPLSIREIREVEARLSELGYWTGPVDGRFDEATRHALIAFQKVTNRPRTGRLTRSERAAVMRASRPTAREGGPAHIEIDLDRQVLYYVDDEGVVTRVLPVSTGNNKDFIAEGWERTAITPIGRFTVMNKIAGWRKSALGRLYYPNYIIGGIAIHGYESVPVKPASHGCIRIPMFAAKDLYRLAPLGMNVIVYEGAEEEITEQTEIDETNGKVRPIP